MKIAIEIAQLSYAERKKVGAILVKDNSIISMGYNGTVIGSSNQCEINDVTVPEVLHAESNIISKIAKSSNSSVDSTLYVTLSPCFDCAKLLIQCGITKVYYLEEYRNTDGIKFLLNNNIECIQVKLDDKS